MSVSLLPHRAASAVQRVRGGYLLACLMLAAAGGCTAVTTPIDAVPAKRVPPQYFAEPKNDLVPIDISRLSIEPPRDYQLAGGDIVGVYIEGVLPFNPPDQPPEPPPVNFPEAESELPPSIGYPVAIQADGTLDLPSLPPLQVEGLTLEQVREKIRQSYIDEQILRPEKARPIVSLIRKRTVNVIVVREDASTLDRFNATVGFIRGGSDRSAAGSVVKLDADKADILNALVETGGLPGLNAKNEVKVLRATRANKELRDQWLAQFRRLQAAAEQDPCICPPQLPDDPSILRIPLRLPPGVEPSITEDDVRLNEGDIVYIQSRETEVFYTGGLLPGGEFPLPRDYDLDVLGAMALAGAGVAGQSQQRGGGAFASQLTPVPPGRLYILRKTPCEGQIAIEVDLVKAINDPRQRPLVAPGDVLILQFKCEEELINFGIGTFFTFGIRELLRGN